MTKAEYMRTWRAGNPDYREYMRAWRAANAEHLKAYRRERYLRHRDQEIGNAVRWQLDNVVAAAICRKAASANKKYPGRLTAQDIRDVIERQGWVCWWCKKTITKLRDFTLEHLQPVNDPAHLTIACGACNSAKLPRTGRQRVMTPEERERHQWSGKKAYDKRWKQENREQENAAQRARYHAKVDERRAYFREWQRKKRERERAAQ